MGVKLTGLREFVEFTKRTPEVIGRTVDSVLREEARALCVNLAASTMPGGYRGGLADEPVKDFERSIVLQVQRVFATREEKGRLIALVARRSPQLARAFSRAVKEGNEAQQRRYLREAGIQSEALDAGVHRAARTSRGNSISKKQQAEAVVPANQRRRYAREQSEKAGLAKAAWYAAAKAIRGRVRRNLVDGATGKRRTEEIFPPRLRKLARRYPGIGGAREGIMRVEVFSNLSYASEALPEALLDEAVARAREQFAREIRKKLALVRRKDWRLAS